MSQPEPDCWQPDRKLTKEEVAQLQRQIPHDDVIARQQGVGTFHGPIEAAEDRIPWLKRRRQQRGRAR